MPRPSTPNGGTRGSRAVDDHAPVPGFDDARVPGFGTWPRIHAAVIAAALVVMALLALFSRWPF